MSVVKPKLVSELATVPGRGSIDELQLIGIAAQAAYQTGDLELQRWAASAILKVAMNIQLNAKAEAATA